MGGVAFAMGAPWPKTWLEVCHIAVAGALFQARYFGGVWLAMGIGVGAGVTALIVCMQPILTAAVVGPLLGERVSRRQWLGLILCGLGRGAQAGVGTEHDRRDGVGIRWPAWHHFRHDLSEEVLRRDGTALWLGYPVFLVSPINQSACANLRSRGDPLDPGLRCGVGLHGCLPVSDFDDFVDHYDPARGGLPHEQYVLSGTANGDTAELFDLG